jgi:hypothetical protein
VEQQASVAASPVVVPFALGVGITRNDADESALVIPANSDIVRIAAELEHDSRLPIQARLRTPEGASIWKNDPAQPPVLAASRSVSLDIPAKLLANGHYILTLSAMNSNGAFEDIADYSFLIRKQ